MNTADDDGFLSRWSRRKVRLQRGLPVAPEPAEETATLGPAAAAVGLPPAGAQAVAGPAAASPGTPAPPEDRPPPPTLEDARRLSRDSDFRRFVARDVDPQVRNTALKTLFSDPHFNVMDGLDIYIDDYGKPDPLPPGMLRQMVQSAALGLFRDDKVKATAAMPAAAVDTSTDPAVDASAETSVEAQADATPTDPATLPAPAPAPAPSPATATARPPDTPPDEDTDLRLQPDDDAGRPGPEPGALEDSGRQR